MGNSDYSIIDWAYGKIDSFDSEGDVESQVDEKAEGSSDGGAAWFRFKDSVPDWIDHPSKKGITLRDFIDEKEEEVEAEEEKIEKEQESNADSIIKEISRADTLTEIDSIDIDIEDSDARTRAISEWNEKRFEIQERIEEETGEFPT